MATRLGRKPSIYSAPQLTPSEAIAEALRNEQDLRSGQRIDFMEWALKAPEPKSGTLDFNRFPIQKELYLAGVNDPETVIRKSTQVGISAWGVRWCLYHADTKGWTGLYVFPTQKDVYDFSDARIRPVIEASPYLLSRQSSTDPDNKGLRGLGLGLCFGAGTMVLTRAGHVPIEEVRPGNEVLTHHARWRRVTKVAQRRAATLRVIGTGLPGVVTTAEHPFRVREQLPPSRKKPWRGKRRFAGPRWETAGDLALGRKFTAQVLPPVEDDDHSTDWWWIIGRYLADGYVKKDGYMVEIASHHDEADELEARLRRCFPDARRHERKFCTVFYLHGKQFCDDLAPFGRLAHGKRLTSHALSLPPTKAEALLDGYLTGDGSEGKRGTWTASTVSRALALGIALLAQRARGVVASVSFIDLPPTKLMPPSAGGKLVNQRPKYSLYIPRRNHAAFTDMENVSAWRPVKHVESAEEQVVWNLEVEGDESFTADGAVVHNCYFRGSESKRGLDSVDADHIVFDEYDTLSQLNIPDAERRVTGSLHGLIRRVGVPSIPDYGIDELYSESDQRQWHTKCGSCGDWQPIDFFENVDQVKMIRVCRRCTKPLDVAEGEWVPEFPDRSVRGYHVSRLIVPGANIEQIVKASKKKAPYLRQIFFNKDLGVAYAPAEGRLSKEAIAAAQSAGEGITMVPGYAGANLTTMGIDVASVRNLNVRISEHISDTKKRALWIGEVESFNDLEKLMRRYHIKMAAIDHLPEGRLARDFANKFPGRVFLVAYDTTPNPKTPDVIKVDDEMRFTTVRRVEAIDAMNEMIRTQDNLLTLDLPDDYVQHLQANVRFMEKDELGKVTVSYRATGPDDYAQAETYDIVATELWWRRQGLDEAERDVYKPLEEMLEFERSSLAGYDDVDYKGPGDEGYAGGR